MHYVKNSRKQIYAFILFYFSWRLEKEQRILSWIFSKFCSSKNEGSKHVFYWSAYRWYVVLIWKKMVKSFLFIFITFFCRSCKMVLWQSWRQRVLKCASRYIWRTRLLDVCRSGQSVSSKCVNKFPREYLIPVQV